MNVKLDTKEKFHEISLLDGVLTANMTADFAEMLSVLQNQVPFNVVLSMEQVREVHPDMQQALVQAQQAYYERHYSFVICCLQPAVEEAFDKAELLEMMNTTSSFRISTFFMRISPTPLMDSYMPPAGSLITLEGT